MFSNSRGAEARTAERMGFFFCSSASLALNSNPGSGVSGEVGEVSAKGIDSTVFLRTKSEEERTVARVEEEVWMKVGSNPKMLR